MDMDTVKEMRSVWYRSSECDFVEQQSILAHRRTYCCHPTGTRVASAFVQLFNVVRTVEGVRPLQFAHKRHGVWSCHRANSWRLDTALGTLPLASSKFCGENRGEIFDFLERSTHLPWIQLSDSRRQLRIVVVDDFDLLAFNFGSPSSSSSPPSQHRDGRSVSQIAWQDGGILMGGH